MYKCNTKLVSYFVRSGRIYSGSLSSPNPFYGPGQGSNYWSSYAGPSNGTHYLYFGSSVTPSASYNYYRYFGLPLRCLAS